MRECLADHLGVARADGGPRAIGRRELPVEHAPQHLRRIATVERQASDQHLVQHHTQAEHVGASRDVAALDLLGGHVRGGAEHLPRGRDALRVEQLGDAEIGDLDVHRIAVRRRGVQMRVGDENVLGFDVAVHDAEVVGVFERLGDLDAERRADLGGRWPSSASSRRNVTPRISSTTR